MPPIRLSLSSRRLVTRAAAEVREGRRSLVVAQLFGASKAFGQTLDDSLHHYPSTPAKRRLLLGAYKRGELDWLLRSGRITAQALDDALERR